jgi:hypothetical protein
MDIVSLSGFLDAIWEVGNLSDRGNYPVRFLVECARSVRKVIPKPYPVIQEMFGADDRE